ncbi:MAG: hypothetical protein AABY87_04530 [bacterium]
MDESRQFRYVIVQNKILGVLGVFVLIFNGAKCILMCIDEAGFLCTDDARKLNSEGGIIWQYNGLRS